MWPLASSMQCACAIVIRGLPRSTIFFFPPTLSHKRQDFLKKRLPNTTCVFRFSVQRLSETVLILRNKRDTIKKTGTAVAQWLRCCATNRMVAGSIPASVSGFFIDIKSF